MASREIDVINLGVKSNISLEDEVVIADLEDSSNPKKVKFSQVKELCKQDLSSYYTKSEVDLKLDDKLGKGDTYTRDEINSKLALKADKGESYTKSQTYSKSEVDEKVDSIAIESGILVQNSEHAIGNYVDEIFGETSAIYEQIVPIPKSLVSNTVDTIVSVSVPVAVEPNKYLKLENLEVLTSLDNNQVYLNNFLELDSIELLSDSMSVKFRVTKPLPTEQFNSLDAKFAIRYCKINADILKFTVTHLKGSTPTISIPHLKYFKHSAFTFTLDDSVVGAWCAVHPTINRRKLWTTDGELRFHKGWTPGPSDTYEVASTALDYDNGTGRRIRYTFSNAIWPNLGDEYSPDGRIKDSSTGHGIYICWDELQELLDYGNSMMYHNVDERIWDKNSPSQIIEGFSADRAKAKEKLGIDLKLLGQPDGNVNYIEAAKSTPLVQFMRQSAPDADYIHLHTIFDPYHKNAYGNVRGSTASVVSDQLADIATQMASDDPTWSAMTRHTVNRDSDAIPMFKTIYDTYSAPGTPDKLLVSSWDEIYEWFYFKYKNSINITTENHPTDSSMSISTITVVAPYMVGFLYKSISLMIDATPGIDTPVSISPVSPNIVKLESKATSSGGNGRNINIYYGSKYEELADKYTSIYEATEDSLDKESALYFVGFLNDELATPYINRINAVETPVEIDSISINIPTTVKVGEKVSGIITCLPTNNTVMSRVNITSVNSRTTISNKSIVGNTITFDITGAIEGADQITASYNEITQSANITVEKNTEIIPITNISLVSSNTECHIDDEITMTATCLPANNTEMSKVGLYGWEDKFTQVSSSINSNQIIVVLKAKDLGTSTILSKVDNVELGNSVQVIVKDVTPVEDRSLLSFGWDYKIAAGGVYDEDTKATKIRFASNELTGTVFKTEKVGGQPVKFADYTFNKSVQIASTPNFGHTTGDNSGVYPDSLIQGFCYGNTVSGDYTFTLNNVANGSYKLKYFVNMSNANFAQDILNQVITVKTSAGDTIIPSYTSTSEIIDNFTKAIEVDIEVGDGTISINLSASEGKSGLRGFMQIIELIKI